MDLTATGWSFVFPGQGSQAVGMGRALAETHPEAMAVWDEATGVLGFPLKTIAWEGSEAELTRTDVAQPALLTASVAALRVVERYGARPRAVAGHSAGEYAALVAAGSLRFRDALQVIRTRGESMQAAAEAADGGMAAVLGADLERLEALCAEIGGVAPANINAPGQVVVSGLTSSLDALESRIKETGARRMVRLNVAGPFHSPAMAPAATAVREALERVVVQDPITPIYANVTAHQALSADEVRDNLVAQVESRVRWEESVRNMEADGNTYFLELGTGTVLAGLIRRIAPQAVVFSVGDPESLAAFLEAAKQ